MRSPTACAGSTRTRTSVRSRLSRATAPAGPYYLCKRYPAIFDLFLRGFAPALLRRAVQAPPRIATRCATSSARTRRSDVIGIPALSGAFMLVKRDAIDRTGGFDPKFFLYFEDFDWSVRLNLITKTAYVPSGADRPSRRPRVAQGPASHRLVRAQRLAVLSAARLEMVLRAVVTGADGFIGRACVPLLLRAGYDVRGLVRALGPDTVARAEYHGGRRPHADCRACHAPRVARCDARRPPRGARPPRSARRRRRCAR